MPKPPKFTEIFVPINNGDIQASGRWTVTANMNENCSDAIEESTQGRYFRKVSNWMYLNITLCGRDHQNDAEHQEESEIVDISSNFSSSELQLNEDHRPQSLPPQLDAHLATMLVSDPIKHDHSEMPSVLTKMNEENQKLFLNRHRQNMSLQLEGMQDIESLEQEKLLPCNTFPPKRSRSSSLERVRPASPKKKKQRCSRLQQISTEQLRQEWQHRQSMDISDDTHVSYLSII